MNGPCVRFIWIDNNIYSGKSILKLKQIKIRSNEIIIVNCKCLTLNAHCTVNSGKYRGFGEMPFLMLKQIKMEKDTMAKWNEKKERKKTEKLLL